MSRDLSFISTYDWDCHGKVGNVCCLCPIHPARQQGTTPALLLFSITHLNPSKCSFDGGALASHHPTFESGFQYQFWSFWPYGHEENRLVFFSAFTFFIHLFVILF